MNENKLVHNRHSIRLQGYDYADEGGYYVTIVTHNRLPIFGEVVNGEMVLNEFGKIVQEEWLITKALRKNVEIFDDEYCIMPNHFHGIIWITDNRRDLARDIGKDTARRVPTTFGKPVANSLFTIIGAFKGSVTRRINRLREISDPPIWQKRFYDHIIRDENEYDNIVNYIYLNPQNWIIDEENR